MENRARRVAPSSSVARAYPEIPPWTRPSGLVKERRSGFFNLRPPLKRFREEVELFGTRTTATWASGAGTRMTVAAVVTGVKRQTPRRRARSSPGWCW